MEVPSELVDAHRAGRLVLFVGAGASIDSPANLPDFGRLTRTIADQAHYSINDADRGHPDVVLGRMKDRGVDVHLRVADLLNDPASTHNRLHDAIIALGLAGPVLRIVTTNFDRHLTSALDATGTDAEEYAAPALPVGNDFAGLVYLHGTLRQPPHRLVLTDDNFGTAYLRDAWAARFLERMFAEYSVLFIGYSHGDVVMRYLARALGPDGHRFVLTSTPDAQNWTDLGLRPIGYEVVGDSHAALGGAVARWAEIAAMGLLDHRRRVAELVSAPPSGIPEDDSYLEELIADPERAGLFAEFARGPAWLDWASNQQAFKNLLARDAQPKPTDQILARWFVESYVIDETHTAKALSLVSESGGFLGPELCHWIGFHLHRQDGSSPPWLGPWLVLLLRDSPPAGTHWLDYALAASTWPADREQLLLLFDHLTEPTAGLATSFGLGSPRIDVHLRGNDHWLRETWTSTLRPNIEEAAHAVVAIADRHLRRICDLQVAAHQGTPAWDSLSFRRSAIEPHPQDTYSEPIDVLIDAARDGIEVLIDASDPIAAGYLHTWANADSQLLRRLAAHGWSHRNDIDASAKIELVVQTGWVTDHRVRHEVFRLIAEAIPDASNEAIGALIANVQEAQDDEPDYRPYERYNALVWMDRHRPEHPAISKALAKAHAVDPSWQERKHPDLTHSMESGTVPSRPPMSVDELRQQLETDPTGLLLTLQAYKGASRWDDGPTWSDALELITSTVRVAPSDGFRFLDIDPPDPEATEAVVRGWSRAELDQELATDIVKRITSLDLGSLVGVLASMLADGSRLEGHPTDWTGLPEARHLARELWALLPDETGHPDTTDWLTHAINHPAGNLAEFWLHAIGHDWRADEAKWSGLTEEHRNALKTMLSGLPEQARTQMAEIICVSRLHFLSAADADWTTENVMPLLDWSDPVRARRSWNSFASWGRWNDQMLDAGLMDHYLTAARHLDELDGEHRGVLGHLAGIALTSQRNPLEWLPSLIVDLSDEDRTKFADDLTDVLDDLPSEAVEHEWSRWIRVYWTDRLSSVPTQLSFDECSAMAGWIPPLTESFEEGADLVARRPGGFREHDDVLRHLERRVDGSPGVCAHVIGHLMRGTNQPWWGGHALHTLWPRMVSGSDPVHLDVIVEQAIRLGLGNPRDW